MQTIKYPHSSVNGPYHSWARRETTGELFNPTNPLRCSLCGAQYNTAKWSAPCQERINVMAKKGMNLTLAEVRFAFKKLTGQTMSDSMTFQEAGDRLWNEFGEAKIKEALAGYSKEDYLAGKYDC